MTILNNIIYLKSVESAKLTANCSRSNVFVEMSRNASFRIFQFDARF